MAQKPRNSYDEMEQLRRRLEEFRSANPVRSRFPEALWVSAAELAKRYGLNATARALGLDPPSLRKWVEKRVRIEREAVPPPAFVELLAPAATTLTGCNVEVEGTEGGKLRLELKAITTTELANLIRAFVGR
jgi:hypothetical protein